MTILDPSARNETLKDLMHTLYFRTRQRHQNELQAIIMANSELCKNAQNEMSFRGVFYHYGEKTRNPDTVNILQGALRPKFKTWRSKVETLEGEYNLVRGFFQKVFMQSDKLEDLYKLIPVQLHGALRNTRRYFVQEGSDLTDEDIEAFVKENQKYMDLVATRMTYNLLEVNHV